MTSRYPPLPHVRIVGLGHKARTGKDVAAQALLSYVYGAKIYGFSDAISAVCRVQHGMTVRDPPLLQKVGLEARQERPGVWLDAVYWKLEEDRPPLAVITGVRFPDEVEMIRSLGGEVWRVDRFNRGGSPFVATDRPDGHPTETALDGFAFDRVLSNTTGSMDGFLNDVREAFQAWYWAQT